MATWASYTPTGGTATTSNTMWVSTSSATTTLYWVDTTTGANQYVPQVREVHVPVKHLERDKQYDLPDGGKLKIDSLGNYVIEDDKAQVIYKANRIREFNPYLNASDLLEDFIRDMGKEGVKQSELLELPINVFIHWLILQAALKDGDPVDDVKPPRAVLPRKIDRCKCCGRFLPKVQLAASVFFCSGDHLNRYVVSRLGAVGHG